MKRNWWNMISILWYSNVATEKGSWIIFRLFSSCTSVLTNCKGPSPWATDAVHLVGVSPCVFCGNVSARSSLHHVYFFCRLRQDVQIPKGCDGFEIWPSRFFNWYTCRLKHVLASPGSILAWWLQFIHMFQSNWNHQFIECNSFIPRYAFTQSLAA